MALLHIPKIDQIFAILTSCFVSLLDHKLRTDETEKFKEQKFF